VRRHAARATFALVASTALAAGVTAAANAAPSNARLAAPSHASSAANPYDPAYGHPYRHGAVPTVPELAKMKQWDATHASTNSTKSATHASTSSVTSASSTGSTGSTPASSSSSNPWSPVSYGGGVDGIGVTSGHIKVYLVFYGNQWGTASTNSHGDMAFSNDPDAGAPMAQELFKGIGTGGERWSGSLTQWCDGPNVAYAATSCPSNANFVPYMSGGTLSGVWYDDSVAEPAAATGHQLGAEALAAAHHFGNTTAASNRYAYYVILSAHGTNPDSYQSSGFCAWHDYNGDSTLNGGAIASNVGDFSFSNQPYTMDEGKSCGQGWLNTPGTLDGYSMVLGHEFGENVSDQNPYGGWNTDANGYEIGDLCAWYPAGSIGAAANVTMGTGAFAMQSLWSNDDERCDISHPALNHSETITINPKTIQFTTLNQPITPIQMSGYDSFGKKLTWQANGLPPGVSINPATGLISGTPTANAGFYFTYTISAFTDGAMGWTNIKWYIDKAPKAGISQGGFEGGLGRWDTYGAIDQQSIVRSGSWALKMSPDIPASTTDYGDSGARQAFIVPAGNTKLSFWYDTFCPNNISHGWVTARVTDETTGITTTVLPKTCVANSGWAQLTTPVTAGHTVAFWIISHDDGSNPASPTHTVLDDVTTS
jgi:serine protease